MKRRGWWWWFASPIVVTHFVFDCINLLSILIWKAGCSLCTVACGCSLLMLLFHVQLCLFNSPCCVLFLLQFKYGNISLLSVVFSCYRVAIQVLFLLPFEQRLALFCQNMQLFCSTENLVERTHSGQDSDGWIGNHNVEPCSALLWYRFVCGRLTNLQICFSDQNNQKMLCWGIVIKLNLFFFL